MSQTTYFQHFNKNSPWLLFKLNYLLKQLLQYWVKFLVSCEKIFVFENSSLSFLIYFLVFFSDDSVDGKNRTDIATLRSVMLADSSAQFTHHQTDKHFPTIKAWISKTKTKLTLQPSSNHSLEFKAIAISPGLYDLNAFDVFYNGDDEGIVIKKPDDETVIRVIDTSQSLTASFTEPPLIDSAQNIVYIELEYCSVRPVCHVYDKESRGKERQDNARHIQKINRYTAITKCIIYITAHRNSLEYRSYSEYFSVTGQMRYLYYDKKSRRKKGKEYSFE